MKCPCCGHLVDTLPVEGLTVLPWSPIETTIIRCLVKRYPVGVELDKLIFEVYGMRNDQPENADMCIRLALSRLRRKLTLLGWGIPKGKGGHGYRHEHKLVRL